MAHGPNVTKLIMKFCARNVVPPGGGFVGVFDFITNPEKRLRVLARAEGEAISAIALIKAAPDNPYGDDDEKIAGVLLAGIEERKKEQYTARRNDG